MTYTLGIDIGTFESKGVLVDHSGNVAAMATAPHEMLVPQPGWAEHRPDDDWWGDFVTITRKLLADTGTDPAEIKAGTLQAWAKDVDYRHLAAAVSNVAGDSPHARKLADRWTASRNEMVGCAGWHTLATIARDGLPPGSLDSFGVEVDGTIFGSFSNGAIRTLGRVVLATFDEVTAAANAVGEIIAAGIVPGGLEMMDNPAIRAAEDFVHAGYPVDAAAILLCELDGTEDEVAALLREVTDILQRCDASDVRVAQDDEVEV